MKRLWSAFLTSLVAAGPVLAQPTPAPIGPGKAPPAPTLSVPSTIKTPAAPASPETTPPQSPTTASPILEQTGPGCVGAGCGNGARPWRTAGACECDTVCGPAGRVFGEFDYILWQPRGDSLPALLTTSPPGTAQAAAGVLGAPGTTSLFGLSNANDNVRSGFRGNLGAWLNSQQTFGIQAGVIFLGDGSENKSFSSSGTPILARPFNDVIANAPASQLIAFPGILSGNINFDERTSFDAFDILLRSNMCCGPQWRVDALLGYRYMRLADQLRIAQNITAGPDAPGALGIPTGTRLTAVDSFDTDNVFHGLEVGVAAETRFLDRWFLNGGIKVAFGYLNQGADIAGVTTTTIPGLAPIRTAGGLLALSSNIGNKNRSEGQMVPELNLNIGYELSSNVRLRAGYTFLYLDNVFRPGTIIDTSINPNLIPPASGAATPASPQFDGGRNDFYLHGISAGVEIRF